MEEPLSGKKPKKCSTETEQHPHGALLGTSVHRREAGRAPPLKE